MGCDTAPMDDADQLAKSILLPRLCCENIERTTAMSYSYCMAYLPSSLRGRLRGTLVDVAPELTPRPTTILKVLRGLTCLLLDTTPNRLDRSSNASCLYVIVPSRVARGFSRCEVAYEIDFLLLTVPGGRASLAINE